MENKSGKRMSPLKLILLIVGILLLAAIITVLAVGGTLLVKYNNSAYEYQEPVESESEFIMPEYPEVVITPEGEWNPDDETVVPETEPETAETTPETAETAPETENPEEIETETEEPETEEETKPAESGDVTEQVSTADPNETKKPETQKPETKPYIPPETLPNVVNPTPETQPAETIKYNTEASFSNAPNAVSVYGKTPIYKVDQKNKDIVNVLVMGTDTRDVTLDRGRSDTMIVVSYNSKTGEVKLTSLLRDSLVYINGVGWNRINTAYFYGGVGLAINTVNQIYGLDIQQFMVIDFNGVNDFFDYIGGLELTFTAEEVELYNQYWGTNLTAGTHQCNSGMVTTHMRNRTIGADFERTRRQRDVITAVVNKVMSKPLNEILDVVDYTFGLIKTNISATDLVSYATSVLGNVNKLSIQSQNVPYSDAFQYAQYNGMDILSYDIAKAGERIRKFIYG